MIESQRAPVSTGSPFYTCTFPGCPFPVNISPAAVEDLHRAVMGAADDCQGLLYGVFAPAGTEVRSFRPIPSFQMDTLDKALAEKGGEVVGCYRIRSAATLQLSAEELVLAEARFSRPGSVVLLIRRDPVDSEANFFFREDGKYLNFPLLSFPLDASRLQFTAAPEPPAASPDPPSRSRPRRQRKLVLGIGAAVIACVAVGFLIYPPRWPIAPPPPSAARAAARTSAATASAPTLPLTAARQGKDLKLTWDPAWPGISHAVSGVLDIQDGGANRRILLETAQIRFGNVLYSPVSDQVTVSLTAVQEDGTAQQGSVLVILGSGGPANIVQPAAVVPARRGAVQPERPFTPPPASSTPADSAATAGEDMPSAALPARPTVTLPPLVPAVEPPPEPERAAAPVGDAGFVPPVLVFEAGVRTPPALRGFEKRPVIVGVHVVLDEAGRVVSAKAVAQQHVHMAYVQAAEAAAQRCRFRPARKGNVAVASEVVMNFRFMPDQ